MSDAVQEQPAQDTEDAASKVKSEVDELLARVERLSDPFTPQQLRMIHDVFYVGRWNGKEWDQIVTPILEKCRQGMEQ